MLRPALIDEIREYLAGASENSRVYIGCDSSRHKNRYGQWSASYTTAVVVHHIDEYGIGHGCKVFCDTEVMEDYDQRSDRPAMRMMNEAFKSVEAYQ